ncbi:hypothetical protein [Mucilaginibacter phyllosphaerae]|uniref:Uncharacterized protein n=1 Tax=Mucilaginibacter phyllosphaerae TaxID=1812349 RepID=A0A4Y8AJT2_9SPHI|nr:hypothetical protein [Mucilaginibacter phyllosphaerae]MBB3967657.1 hypothetical protein [Mucilaginibacter phyllosphaerae]TEW69288.1 hypothetical protein E2R65_03735 [Mucilaginibacter phyllosphaerae]GGH04176.1 hypothetical protein GCM10007352_07220 [Mucilaginibacter phyllosphaerae]
MNELKNYQKNALSREEAKKVLGGLRDVNADCPGGTHEFICVTSAPGESGVGSGQLIRTRYCVPDTEPNPPCSGPS